MTYREIPDPPIKQGARVRILSGHVRLPCGNSHDRANGGVEKAWH